MSKVTI